MLRPLQVSGVPVAAQIEARPVVVEATLGISGVIVATCDLDHWGIHICLM